MKNEVLLNGNVTYVDSACCGATTSSSVKANCLAIKTSNICTTSVLKVSKSPNVLNHLCLIK